MTQRAVILRETLVSLAINIAITIAFFFATFGLAAPPPPVAFGLDFLPQSFMVALMGSLIPGLLVRRASGAPARPIIVRAFALAIGAAALGGGGACLLFAALPPVAPWLGLTIKIVFTAILSAIVTPIAVRHALTSCSRSAS